MVYVNLDDEAESKLREFEELVRETYNKYRKFYELKCKLCKKNCKEVAREIEIHIKFITYLYNFTVDRLSERMDVGDTITDGILINQINIERLFQYFKLYNTLSTTCNDVDYIR
ncbi:hypothetical protein DRO97_08135 [Archaeoglobales archaeon]|nr:MAG: hypothetical protein DRO97_08135 [Archaeoglobales archaeon]